MPRATVCPTVPPHARTSRRVVARVDVRVHPCFRRLPPPIIVVGMHRSGTSVVSSMLGCLGVYMGPELAELQQRRSEFWTDPRSAESGYGEADDFRGVNDRILAQAGAAWDDVDAVLSAGLDSMAGTPYLRTASQATYGCLRTSYLSAAPTTFGGRWGWKDPRNSVTLPTWMELFPGSLVLHVRRDRQAVVNSLHRRAVAWSTRKPEKLSVCRRAAWCLANPAAAARAIARKLYLTPATPGAPDPCLDIDYCGRLYDAYTTAARSYAAYGGQYVEIQYEELLASPQHTVRRMAGLLNLQTGDSELAAASQLVNRR